MTGVHPAAPGGGAAADRPPAGAAGAGRSAQAQVAGSDPERLLEVVAHAAPVVIWAMDAHGICTLSTGGGLAAFGVTDGELVGRNVFELFPDGASRTAVTRALTGESYRARVQLMGRDFITWYEPEWAADGKLRGCTAVSVDVSGEQLRDDLELEQARDRAAVLHHLLANDETDRRAVARELHDDVIQVVTGLGLRVDLLRQVAQDAGAGEGSPLDEELASFDAAVTAMTARLRALVGTLEPLDVAGGDLDEAIGSLVDQAMVPLDVATTVVVDAQQSPSAVVARVLYRVVQEALTNVARHARASHVDVTVHHVPATDRWLLEVRDDGIGATSGYGERPGHRGLRGMRERVELAGGRLAVSAAPSGGTMVRAEVPGRLPGHPQPDAADVLPPDLARVLSTVADAMAVVDHAWRVLYVNERARQMLGLSPGADVARDLWSLVGVDGHGPGRGMLERAMEEKRETTFEAPFGELWLRVRAVPSREGLLVLARDLTAQRNMQRLLLEGDRPEVAAQPRLQAASAVVSALVSSGRFVRAQVVTDELGVLASASYQAAAADEVGEPVVVQLEGGRLQVTACSDLSAEDEAVLDLAARTLQGLRPPRGGAAPTGGT